MKATVYRTDHFTPDQITHMIERATDQEKEIARWFVTHPNAKMGPSQLHELIKFPWPLTSTRRAITNLTNDGILEKTDETRRSIYHRPEHLWRWKKPNRNKPKQGSLF